MEVNEMESNVMEVQMEVKMEVDKMEVEMELPLNENGNVEFPKEDHLVEDYKMDLSEVSDDYSLGVKSYIQLLYHVQRAEALVQVLGEVVSQGGNDHHGIQLEIIEEHLLQAKEILEQTNP